MKIKLNSLYKKEIRHIYVNKLIKNNLIFSIVMVIGLLMSSVSIKYIDSLSDYAEKCVSIYYPVDPLFNDGGKYSFTNVNYESIEKNNLKFITPIKCSEISIVDGEINYVIDSSIMVIAPEDGIVKEIGILPNGEKYITIVHSHDITSRIENIYITGVTIGQVIAKGQDIATAQVGSTVKFAIYENGNVITNIKVVKNSIQWES